MELKTKLIAIMVLAACAMAPSSFFPCRAAGVGSKDVQYTGIVKGKSQSAHIFNVLTPSGEMKIHYQRHGRVECDGFRELNVGDTVTVIAKGAGTMVEATCVRKTKPAPTR